MSRAGPDFIDLEAKLDEGLQELGLPLEPGPRQQLVELCRLVDRGNTRRNLTGHPDPTIILQRLVLDAVALWMALDAPSVGGPIVDLGSGAGFPGIPFAILAPARRVILVDARERRYHFQRTVQRTLRLANLQPTLGRIEDLEPDPAELVVAQALAKPRAALEYGLRWLEPAGRIVLPGSEEVPDPGPHAGIGESGSGRYRVPSGGPSRSFWWGRAAAP